jgi:3-hydroxyacyl-[acyl-carrier-protein] dehydratase
MEEIKSEQKIVIKTPMDVNDIKKIIPHRYPFLFVDRVEFVDVETKTIRGYKNVTANEPFFQGHFPDKPIMPGVLIGEALAQLGAVMVLSIPDNIGKIALLLGIDNAKFRRAVVPGDRLDLEAHFLVLSPSRGKAKGVASVNGQIVAEVETMFAILKEK